jgi:hypothetical protein
LEIKDGQYENGLKYAKGAEDGLQQLMTCLKRRDDASRIRRVIEDVESLVKKVKRELRVG